MESLRNGLTDNDLRQLLERTYVPSRVIVIEYEIKRTKFAEDMYLQPTVKKIRRVKGSVPQKVIPPSERFREHVDAFMTGGAEPTAETVLGFYFTLYKQFFHEEDPEWAGAPSTKAVTMVERLATEVAENDYRRIVVFIRKIMPLWVDQLKQGSDFPNNRPTVNALFGSSRYFWTNRNLLYKRWQEK